MPKVLSEREFISKNFNFLRVLQAETLNKRNAEEIKRLLNISRTTIDRMKQDLIDANVITERLTINQNYATFMGISISYSKIEISVVGMDGKTIPWNDILSQIQFNHKDFNGNISFNYSISELINIFAFINELILAVQSKFSLKAICIAFDYVDLKNETFSLTEYFKDSCAYSFDDFCAVCFGEIQKGTVLFLDCNAMCKLVSEEFPMLKRNYNSLCFNIKQNGCFGAVLSHNTLHCGYNMQTLNLSGILNTKEKKDLESNYVSDSGLLEICIKILKALIIPVTPELIYISGKTISQNSKFSSLLSFQIAEVFSLCLAKDYNPNIKLFPISASKGAAIIAMYRYYGWDYSCI